MPNEFPFIEEVEKLNTLVADFNANNSPETISALEAQAGVCLGHQVIQRDAYDALIERVKRYRFANLKVIGYRMKCLPVLALFFATHLFAQDTQYAFRGIGLGASLSFIEAAAPAKFDVVRPVDKVMDDLWAVHAGTTAGLDRGICPFADASASRTDCLKAVYTLRPYGFMQVLSITATQSFKHEVPLDVFMSRMSRAYGAPRATYEGRTATPSGLREKTLLWGGARLPVGHFSPSSVPFEDAVLLGGKYLLLHVMTTPAGVTGYELRVSDADKVVALDHAWKAQQHNELERAKKASADSVRF